MASTNLEFTNAGTTERSAQTELTESDAVHLAMDIYWNMGVSKLSQTERARLCQNLIRGLKVLTHRDVNAKIFIKVFEQLSQTKASDIQGNELLTGPAHPLSRQLIAQPLPELPF